MRHETTRDYNAGYYAEQAEAEARKRQEEEDAKCPSCGKPHDCSEVCDCTLCGRKHAYSNGSAAWCKWDHDLDAFVAAGG